nr:hypothetical protein [Tanacetum cinerariifolium]
MIRPLIGTTKSGGIKFMFIPSTLMSSVTKASLRNYVLFLFFSLCVIPNVASAGGGGSPSFLAWFMIYWNFAVAEYINTPGWNRPAFYNNGDDDDEDYSIAITPNFLITDSPIMGDEHLDTIPKKESDEFIKSSFEDLVPNPSELEDECECDVPDCDDSQTTNFSTFSNPFFDDSTSSDDNSSHEEAIHEMSFKTYSNPLFDLDEEIISSDFNPIHNEDLDSTPKNDRFDTEPYLLESLLNRDTLMASSLKIDSLLAEFAEFVSDNSDTEIESFSPSPIPIEDSDSLIEEIDLSFTPD